MLHDAPNPRWREDGAILLGVRGLVTAPKIEDSLPESERQSLSRALRARPVGTDALSIVDYLYLAQLPTLLFAQDVWQDARLCFGATEDAKKRLNTAIAQIAPVRNEIAHIREVDRDRLLRADLACTDLLKMITLKST